MKRGKPLQRKTALRRKTPMRARGNSKYANRRRETVYMSKVRRCPCSVRALMSDFRRTSAMQMIILPAITKCRGRVEADHAGKKTAYGQKSSDLDCIPMCSGHHRERHDFAGTFRLWKGEWMRAFLDQAIKHTQEFIYEADAYAETAFRKVPLREVIYG